ncbi:hypothetical protein [Roseibium album]|uniref:hypothetical protein n=1 Tax=Roseibium album TaxID=311410 RepID=UPI0032992EBA
MTGKLVSTILAALFASAAPVHADEDLSVDLLHETQDAFVFVRCSKDTLQTAAVPPYIPAIVPGWVRIGSKVDSWEKQNFFWVGVFPKVGATIVAAKRVRIYENYTKQNPLTGFRDSTREIGTAHRGQSFTVGSVVESNVGEYWALIY